MSTPKQIHTLEEYAARLYARRHEGIIIELAEVKIGDWSPQINECHGNVTTWCEHNSQHKPVRGWVHFDYGGYLAYASYKGVFRIPFTL